MGKTVERKMKQLIQSNNKEEAGKYTQINCKIRLQKYVQIQQYL
jgi:hypothetical protein